MFFARNQKLFTASVIKFKRYVVVRCCKSLSMTMKILTLTHNPGFPAQERRGTIMSGYTPCVGDSRDESPDNKYKNTYPTDEENGDENQRYKLNHKRIAVCTQSALGA